MKYYSQYHSHELFELQESLSGLSKPQPLGEACRQSSLGQDSAVIQQASEEPAQRCGQQARPHGCRRSDSEACQRG